MQVSIGKGGKSEPSAEVHDKLVQLRLEQCAEVIDPQPSHRTPPIDKDGIPFISLQDINKKTGKINFEGARKVSSAVLEEHKQRYSLAHGDFIIGKIGTVGGAYLIPAERTFALSANLVLVRPRSEVVDPRFLLSLMTSPVVEKQFSVDTSATTQSAFGIKKVRTILVPLPPLPEQRAIATALSDVDALINSLDRLIAKKRDIKQATMQQLLTGKTRLPGFKKKDGFKQTEIGLIPEDWEPKRLGDVTKFIGGSQPPRSTFVFKPKEGYVRLVQIRDYKTDNYATYIPSNLVSRACSNEDIMIGRYGPPIFQILKGIEGAYNVALIKAIPSKAIEREFLFHFLKDHRLFNFIELLSRRSSGQTGVELPDLKNYPTPLPSLSEQCAIANVLSDIDLELATLEQRREKTLLLKQGMMQELLTGRTRLV